MSLSQDLDPLHALADEIREVWSGEGHSITEALDMHEAFTRGGRSTSALTRDLLSESIHRCAARCGVWPRQGRGGALEILLDLDDRVLVMRVRSARRDAETGEAIILAPSSGEVVTEEAEVPLKPESPWVFAFVRSGVDLVELFAAPIIRVTEHKVPRLELGPEITLGHVPLTKPPTGGFVPAAEEDLDGLDDVASGEHGIDRATGG